MLISIPLIKWSINFLDFNFHYFGYTDILDTFERGVFYHLWGMPGKCHWKIREGPRNFWEDIKLFIGLPKQPLLELSPLVICFQLIPFSKVELTRQQNEKTCTNYNSLKRICHKHNLRIIQEYFLPKIGRKIRMFSLGRKNNILIEKKKSAP